MWFNALLQVLPAPQNGYNNPGFLGQGDQPEPPLHNESRLNRSKNQQTNAQHINTNNNDLLTQNRPANTSAIQPGGHLNTAVFSNNANLDSEAHLPSNQRNSHSNQRNTGSFQQVGQQNPNILIQTGHSEPGPHTVLINLNTLPQHQNATTQPHTVHVSLNAAPPSSGQPNQNTMHFNDQQINAVQQERANTGHSNPRHVSGSHSNPQTRTDNRNTAQPAHSSTLRNGQPRDHPVTSHTRSRQNTEVTNPYSEQTRTQLEHTHSITDDDSDDSTLPRQRPWDRTHGTPAYPNRQVDSYGSPNSTGQNSSEGEHPAPVRRPRRSPVDEQVRSISRASRRNLLRHLAHSAAHRRSRADRNASRQPNAIAQPRADHQSRTAAQSIASHRQGTDNMNMSVPAPQPPTAQMQTAQPAHLISQSVRDQRQTEPLNAATPNSVMLTQAALQQHTSQTPGPFVNRNQQTQAALQHPGTQTAPAQTLPAGQISQAGQVAPVPPPVLRLEDFKALPRQHLQKPHAAKPVHVMRRPVVTHHGHRPPNMPRHPRTVRHNPHQHPVNPHMHTHGFPVHMNQVRLN